MGSSPRPVSEPGVLKSPDGTEGPGRRQDRQLARRPQDDHGSPAVLQRRWSRWACTRGPTNTWHPWTLQALIVGANLRIEGVLLQAPGRRLLKND